MILATGPESSGTRLLTSMLRAAMPDAEVLHRSWPNGGSGDSRRWPYEEAHAATHVVLVVRDHAWTAASAADAGHHTDSTHIDLAREALVRCVLAFDRQTWTWVTYQSLVAHPRQTTEAALTTLGLRPVDGWEPPCTFDADEPRRT